MINRKLKTTVLSACISTLLVGCINTPGKEQNEVTEQRTNAANEAILDNKLKEGINQSVYSESDSYVILGRPFKYKVQQQLPDIFLTPTKFSSYRSKQLGEAVDYLNSKFSPYGVYITFTSDAITFLADNSSESNSGGAIGGDDSSDTSIDVSTIYTDSNTGSLLDTVGVSISLNYDKHVALKQVLDSIAAKTNLWWRLDTDGRVNFYRQDTKYFPINQYAAQTTLNSNISSSTAGGTNSDGTSSSTASNHTFNLTRDLGKPMEQLLAGIKATASEGAKVEVLPALSMVAVTDTPTKLELVEDFIDRANSTAGKMIQMNIELWELITTDTSNYGIEQAIQYTNGKTKLNFDGIPVSETGSLGSFGVSITGGSMKGTEMALRALQGTKSLSLRKNVITTVPNNEVIPVQYVNEKAVRF